MNAQKILVVIARILLGTILTVLGGLNGFFHFIPMPTPPEAASNFFMAMVATGYFLPFLHGTELVVGIMLLLNRFVPLALIIAAAPIQAFLFHVYLDLAGIGAAAMMLTMEAYLGWAYLHRFHEILQAKTDLPE